MTELNQALRRLPDVITASELASILGLNKYKSAQQTFAEKKGLVPVPDEVTPAMERGIYLEPSIVEWTAKRRGIITTPGITVRSERYPIIVATPDAFIHKRIDSPATGVMEVKAPGRFAAQDWLDPADVPDGIPVYYLPQVIWQMAATDTERAIVSALIGGDLSIYEIQWTEKIGRLFLLFLERAQEFIDRLRLNDMPKVEDEAGAEFVRRLWYKQRDPEIISIPDDNGVMLEAARKYKAAKAKEAAAKKEAAIAAGILEQVIGESQGVTGPGFKVTWKQNKESKVVDWKLVAERAGASAKDIEESTTIKEGHRTIRVTIDGEKTEREE